MTTAESADGRRSWLVAAVGTVAMIFPFGTAFSYGVFLGPFAETFDLSLVVLSTVFSVMLFMFFIGAGVVSVFAAHVPARLVLLACTATSGLITPTLYVVESYLGVLVVFGILGLVLGTVFIVIASVVPLWFEERRGAASGLLFAGNGLGLFLLPPTWELVFDRFDVQYGFLLVVGATTAAFFLAGLTCRRPRWVEPTSMTPQEIFEWVCRMSRSRTSKLLFVGVALTFAWFHMIAAYAIELFARRGLTEAEASIAFGSIGGVGILSRLGGGYAADSFGFRRTFLASLGCCVAGIGLLFVPQLSVLVVAIILVGIGGGGIATLYIPLLLRVYSSENDTAIVGLANIAIGIVALAATPAVIGLLVYTGSFLGPILLTLLAAIAAIWTVAAGTTGS